MLNNKKNIYIQLMFWSVKTVQDKKAKFDYRMSILSVYMAGGEGVGVRGFKMFCQRGSDFFTCFVCVCGGGVSFSTSPSVKKITDPRPINK